MSALGHLWTFAVQKGMSALPPIATAKADMSALAVQTCWPICPVAGVAEYKQADRGRQVALLARLVDLSNRLRHRRTLGLRDFLESAPERIFEADAGFASTNDLSLVLSSLIGLRGFCGFPSAEEPDNRHRRLLRARRKRPSCRRATEKCDELASPHCLPQEGGTDVRFGSKADICSAKRHVRFTPNSDHKSRHRRTGSMSITLTLSKNL
jgi:hypothetical protein